MSNTVKLTGEDLLQYLVKRFNMSTSEALASLEQRGVNVGWFDGLDKGLQKAVMTDDPFLTDYIRGEGDA